MSLHTIGNVLVNHTFFNSIGANIEFGVIQHNSACVWIVVVLRAAICETQLALEEYEGGQEDSVKRYLQVCNTRLSALIQYNLEYT